MYLRTTLKKNQFVYRFFWLLRHAPEPYAMVFCQRKQTRLTIVLLMTIITLESAWGGSPVLTGRWGDTRTPEQLTYHYESKKNQALVVVAFSTVCPLAKRLVPTLNRLQQQYDQHGIQFIALFPNGMDDLRAIAEYAVDTNLMFPVFRDDPDNPWHEQLGMTTTPSVVVLDTSAGFNMAAVYYRGQVDGTWFGGGITKQKQDYLADALASFVTGAAPPLAETAPSGCKIAKRSFRDLSSYQDVTYHNQIARLIARSCLECHRDGQPGAELFAAFDSYETVASMSGVMLSRIENRLMPPWHASTDPAHGRGGFQGDVRLTEDEINQFRAWVQRDCPVGDPADAPPEQKWQDASQWKIGQPDLVFQMPEPYHVPTDRFDQYHYYRIPANFPEDRYVQAIELRPGNRAVVHHMGAIIGHATTGDLTPNQMLLKLYGLTGDKIKKLGDYIPGDPFSAHTYPAGYALKLPAGHDIFFEMHYTPTGREEQPDQSQMGILWAKQKPEHVLETQVFNRKDIRLRPHDMHYEKSRYYQFDTDVLIHALAPHMHYRGKDFILYKVTNPGTEEEHRQMILKIAAYDFNWQRTYEFQNPIPLRAGDALYSVAHFDNSHYNPNNPDPEAFVRFGLQSEQEMLNLRAKFERVDLGE
ncbi:MAG: redoxin domain-containing protein [Pirellulales bacterium]|nr:redoxin domain-containing protein [Pirellulales bacterium]